MILKNFTSVSTPDKAIQEANREIEKMALDNFIAKEITQSESVYYNSFRESEDFHFSLTILFVKRKIPRSSVKP